MSNDDEVYYYLKGSHGLYWNVCPDNTLIANSTISCKFSIELLPNNRMIIIHCFIFSLKNKYLINYIKENL